MSRSSSESNACCGARVAHALTRRCSAGAAQCHARARGGCANFAKAAANEAQLVR